jgi:hypothetical protein
MPMKRRRVMNYGKAFTLAVCALGLLFGGLLLGQSTQKKMDMNDIPFAKVKAMLATPAARAKTMKLVKMNHVTLMGGQPINGQSVTLKGELTGADCYLSDGLHGHDHAMCAKACVAHGSPIVFLAQSGTVYLVLTPKDGVPYPGVLLNDLGRPGVTVVGNTLESHGIKAISIQSVRS